MKMKTIVRYGFGLVLAAIGIVSVQCATVPDGKFIQRADSLPVTTPWDLEELSNPPEFEWAEGEKIRSLYYKSEPYKGATTRVFAYYATPGTLSGDPNRDKQLPGIVLVHGGGGAAFPEWVHLWAKRGYAAIAMDLAGCGPEKNVRFPDGGPGQGHDMKFDTIGLPVTEQWTYHAVANVIRAHSNRFKAAVPVYGCGFLHENSAWLGEFAKMSPENKAKWIQLWDPSQYIGSAAMPMLFANGGKDFAYPPDSYAKTYGLVRSEKNIHFVPDLPHGHIFDRPKAIEIFIRRYLEKGVPLPRIATPEIKGTQISAKIETKTKPVEAELHYTLDKFPGDPKTRTWQKQTATINQNIITTKRPPKNTQIWFLTLTDNRRTTVSSNLMFP